jgi:hypothetical protein
MSPGSKNSDDTKALQGEQRKFYEQDIKVRPPKQKIVPSRLGHRKADIKRFCLLEI